MITAPPELAGRKVAWSAQAGAQWNFLSCPLFEVLLEGPRGGGKTEALLMDFAQYVGLGFGTEHYGAIFRHTYPQLADIEKKGKKLFPPAWPSCTFNQKDMAFKWATGEVLRLCYMDRDEDYANHHGHAYTWIGFEELTLWADPGCYQVMKTCIRSAETKRVPVHVAGQEEPIMLALPRHYRATTNPSGPGQYWVKERFGLPVLPGKRWTPVKYEEGFDGVARMGRVAVHCSLEENIALLKGEPLYKASIAAAAANPAQKKAWVDGSWDAPGGGIFDGAWLPEYHVLPFIPWEAIPAGWRRDRSYDHGQAKPFAVLWWVESDGEELVLANGRKIGRVRGDLILMAEWYGFTGKANVGIHMPAVTIADGIKERQVQWGIQELVKPGPADSSIWPDKEGLGKSVESDMRSRGVRWTEADNSRVQGWQQFRKYLLGAIPGPDGHREWPGIFVSEVCEQFLRTVPGIPVDPKKPDDVDTKTEDHIADSARYRLMTKAKKIGVGHG